jgi:CDP-diacylglycerol--glycerol-3-phosphate 3-phosphatidyltransferase
MIKDLPNAQFSEYFKEGWSFHSKGIWAEGPGGVFFSNIGGSNFSHRSFFRDIEFQVYMSSDCPQFRKELLKEKDRIWKFAESDLKKYQLKYKFPTQVLARLFKNFL